jgi:D-glycero-alpha-D-manno-heptose-7-phosphate kinase
MIITRSPLRVSLGGGGTDLPSYYREHTGFVLAAAIDKYVYITQHHTFQEEIILKYSKLERVQTIDQLEHPIVREALRLVAFTDRHLELASMADIPGGTGLGSSGSFTTALLKALHAFKKNLISPTELAEQACDIEINRLGDPIGKQDQYMAAYGGITCLTFGRDGEVLVEPLRISDETLELLESNLLFFFTGKERTASEILKEQDERSRSNDPEMDRNLHQIKDIGLKTREYLEKGQVDMLGELLHAHWETKKKRSQKMTDPFIDECYEEARRKGAMGGKLMGAGGGGFFMFYCQNGSKPIVMEALRRMGLRRERFQIDWDGARIMLNARQSSHLDRALG